MRRFPAILLAALSLSAFAWQGGLPDALAGIVERDLRSHFRFLSHDELRGRAPGTPGSRIAAQYVASQFMRAGLQPVGGRYFQDVPMEGITTDPETVFLGFDAAGDHVEATYGEDAVIWPGTDRPHVQVNGELVFVGYGVESPQYDWDDYKDRDVRDKILLILVNDPPASPDEPSLFTGRELTYFGRWTYKLEEAERRGAAGALLIHTASSAGYGWSVVRSSWTGEQFTLPREETAGKPLFLQGWLTEDLTRRVLAQADLSLEELKVRAARRDFRPIQTGVTVRSRMVSRVRTIGTANVIGFLPGSHETRKDEVVVVTSHYDHLGIGPAVQGDSIYNGAYDNASGVSLLLEVAEAFATLDRKPDRSILFMATAAEEAGMLGAEHYVRHPLIPLQRTVANVNVDGANLWGETDDAIAMGADRSSLGAIVTERAEELGMRIVPDYAPDKGFFFRSDHFPFARAGVPALYIEHGLQFRGRPSGWGRTELDAYMTRNYHQPSDEYDGAFDLSGAVQQARLVFLTAYDIAGVEQPPQWNAGAEFKPAQDSLLRRTARIR